MITRAQLTGSVGYVKFASKSKASRIADKLDLTGTHKHKMDGQTVYMPGSTHSALNTELQKRGFAATKKPTSGSSGFAEAPKGPMGEMGMSQADDEALGGGMMDLEMDRDDEDPMDPLNLGDMGMGQDMMDDNEMFESSHNDDDDEDSGGLY